MSDDTNEENLHDYPGGNADVQWDKRLCIHIGECGRAQGDLFVGGRDPWCQPDIGGVDDVVDVCQRCPTGALTYERKDGGDSESPAAENTVMVANHGPLYVRGDLDIAGAEGDMPGVRFRAALCRCGQSSNKPFCDNSHEGAGFKDYGAVGDKGEALEERGGTLQIKAAKNGPLLLSGNLTILASSGRIAFQGKKAALCRCGESKNKPFCDGAHKRAGFQAP